MEYNEIVIMSRVVTGAAGAFFAILLWSKTREPAWIFVIIGTLCIYIETVFSTLSVFGILSGDILTVYGVPMIKLLLLNMPVIFITIGFILVITGNRKI